MNIIKAIFWDFGGVFTTSPFEAFNRYEQEHGLPQNFIRSINSTNPDDNAWAQFERNDIGLAEFDRLFEQESSAAGHPVAGEVVVKLLYGQLHPEMVAALHCCKQHGLLSACLTNNMQFEDDAMVQTIKQRDASFAEVTAMFDLVQESSKVGVRKPDPRFYQMACEQLDVVPEQVVFLDDLGINLKSARALGLTTIKVVDPMQALGELETVLAIPILEFLSNHR